MSKQATLHAFFRRQPQQQPAVITGAPAAVHLPDSHMFVMETKNGQAYLDYDLDRESGTLDLEHTFVPRKEQGQGIAGKLCEAAFEWAARENLLVIPSCSYVSDTFLKRQGKKYQHLVFTDTASGAAASAVSSSRWDRSGSRSPSAGRGRSRAGETDRKIDRTTESGTGNSVSPSSGTSSSAAAAAPPLSTSTSASASSPASSVSSASGSSIPSRASKRARLSGEGDDAGGPNARPVDPGSASAASSSFPSSAPSSSAPASSSSSSSAPFPSSSSSSSSVPPSPGVPAGHLPLPHHPVFRQRWALACDVLSKPIPDLESLLSAWEALNSRRRGRRDILRGIETFFLRRASDPERTRFFATTLPFLQQLVLELPVAFSSGVVYGPLSAMQPTAVDTASLPVLKAGVECGLQLTRHQCACLLAAAFFSLLAVNTEAGNRFSHPNFDGLFEGMPVRPSQAGKLRCILHYFERLREAPDLLYGKEGRGGGEGAAKAETVLFARRAEARAKEELGTFLDSCEAPLCPFEVQHSWTIEDRAPADALQVDFANRFLGGGVLGLGCVQEEIRFVLSPECLCGLQFCEVMEDEEAILILGTKRFSRYTGYAATFAFAGDYRQEEEEEKMGGAERLPTAIVAIDAVPWMGRPAEQFRTQGILREIRKAFAGFAFPVRPVLDASGTSSASSNSSSADDDYKVIATGNWGCGAFKGDVGLKAMLQWIAASMTSRRVLYFTFGAAEAAELPAVVSAALAANWRVADLWRAVLDYSSARTAGGPGSRRPLFAFLSERLGQQLSAVQMLSAAPAYAAPAPAADAPPLNPPSLPVGLTASTPAAPAVAAASSPNADLAAPTQPAREELPSLPLAIPQPMEVDE